MAEELEQAIKDNAAGPAKASGDSGSMEQHKLTEQIEADKHLARKAAGRNPARAFMVGKIVPPGSV